MKTSEPILLNGLDGSNPLGFLAAVGTAVVLHDTFPEICLGWKLTGEGWRPLIEGCGEDKEDFLKELLAALQNAPMTVFDIDDQLPFDASKFSNALQKEQHHSSIKKRRDADFLSGFGIDLHPDEKNYFQDSSFRMVRRGDSAGHGLPFYVKEIRKKTDLDCIRRTVFHSWDYQDKDYSLRWDPIEDQRYALRWKDPSKSGLDDGPGTMLAANSLAVEALRIFPSVLVGNKVQTTGFQRIGRREVYFVWPVWTPMVRMDTLRSLLALSDLGKDPLPLSSLAKRGIEEVYRSQRIQQNQYYSNFLSAHPL